MNSEHLDQLREIKEDSNIIEDIDKQLFGVATEKDRTFRIKIKYITK